MAKPMNVRRFANLLSADRELDEIERVLRRAGDSRLARKVADAREMLGRAMLAEQEEIWERLIKVL